MLEFEDGFYRSSPGLIQILVEMIMSRTRERCDDLATRGFMVILPDYFRGVVPEECGPGDFACWQGRLGTPNVGSSSYHATIATIILSPLALIPIMAANTNWTRLEADWTLVRSWAEEKGVTTFAAVGKF